MLKVIQKDKLLYLTEQERTEYDLENTQLLYTFPDLSYTDKTRDVLRPFRALFEKKREMYKLSLLDFLPDILYSNYTPIPTSLEEHRRVVEEAGRIAEMMGQDSVDVSKNYDIRYECDTWNSLEDAYGINLAELFKEFMILPSGDQDLVRRVWISGANRRIEVARSGNWMNVYNLLPTHTQSELMIFGDSDEEAGLEGSVLEFRRKEQIGPELPSLRERIYAEFKLGEFLLEGAQDVKDRLEKIYQECGVERNPKAKDLEEWFVIFPCRQKGKRGFRIDFRR